MLAFPPSFAHFFLRAFLSRASWILRDIPPVLPLFSFPVAGYGRPLLRRPRTPPTPVDDPSAFKLPVRRRDTTTGFSVSPRALPESTHPGMLQLLTMPESEREWRAQKSAGSRISYPDTHTNGGAVVVVVVAVPLRRYSIRRAGACASPPPPVPRRARSPRHGRHRRHLPDRVSLAPAAPAAAVVPRLRAPTPPL